MSLPISPSLHFRDVDIRLRKSCAIAKYWEILTDEIGFYEYQQIEFEEQWVVLKCYANERGICITGDIPIYVTFYREILAGESSLWLGLPQSHGVSVVDGPREGQPSSI